MRAEDAPVPQGRDRRLIDPADLVSSWDVGQRLGIDPTLVVQWSKREADFPRPVAQVGKGARIRLWLWPEVERWAKLWGVLEGKMPQPAVVAANDLMTGKEIAELRGWKHPGVAWQMAQRGDFPDPVRDTRPRLWRRSDVERWFADHPPRARRGGA
jgi:predicted DNA-binding transcriptional regulator AlpA